MANVTKLGEMANWVSGKVHGDATLEISGLNGLEQARPGDLSFFGSARYRKQLQETRASAVLASSGAGIREGLSWIEVTQPHLAFAKISARLHPERVFVGGIAPGAHIHEEAFVDPTATVMAGVVIEAGVRVGARTVLYPGTHLGRGALIGDDCRLYSNVSIGANCRVGHRVNIHASTVIGADGFGFAFDPDKVEHFKVPQVGIVRIEDDVEIGACSCVDRATFGETVVGRGTKIDNLVQIAHNVKVGPLSLICAQAGVSGSAEIGTGVVLAGQVGVVGHIRVGDMAKVGAQSGVAQAVPDGAIVSGSPAVEHASWLRNVAASERLSEMFKEIRALRKRLDALEGK